MGLFHSPPTPTPDKAHTIGPSPLCHSGDRTRVRTNWGSWDIAEYDGMVRNQSIQHAVGKMEKGEN